ncbi:MAG: bifunctional demethylmenaquinone methyltransferase/2-methoxy-6-polyprenyl-1,4-benzoquinol methylase UbiE [Prevotella sp.]|nr:bifunctional demethylmenaquinone methyltransferase/2-methoxy-6-polyprenyl-1,4-benzoquinol methylase UbiE [Prevotella sp.]MCM1074564.1 bifunctional demethylmenaquinone methyltransferase/2-methoxy-6-polyprenyl-1,4-benzoquinol methylase UbiE [Ruminococcus sp.]
MADTPEQIKPYNSEADNKGEQVEQMFDSIAPAYDFMNTAMTFGMHRLWRDKALKALCKSLEAQDVDKPEVLDLACGTGDVTFKLAKLIPRAVITGGDLSKGMLKIAERKLAKQNKELQTRVNFRQCDALHLPFADGSFDALTIAYGVRNFENLRAGYTEMLRVLKPGGLLCVIELCEPANPIMRAGYKFYSRTLIPLAGRLVSKDNRAYTYLPESIAACPQREGMTELMSACGYRHSAYRTLFPGVCGIYTAIKQG